MKKSEKILPFSLWALGSIVICVAAGYSFLWWAGTSRPDISFLPGIAPAEWIVCPTPLDVNVHPQAELPVTFEHSFVLGDIPLQSRLRIAGYRRYTVLINGHVPNHQLQFGENWKHPDAYDVTGLLHGGLNRIEVTIFNKTGPAALWLNLDSDGSAINSGNDWQTSIAGSSWLAATPASAPRAKIAYGTIYGLPSPWIALKQRWPTLLVFTLIVSIGWLLSCRKRLITSIALRIGPSFSPSTLNRIRVGFPLIGVVGFWLVLFSNNLSKIQILTGFDAPAHLDYIEFIQKHHTLPMANVGWEMFQPPLYYLISAGWLALLHLSPSDADGILALRILGLAVGITHIAVVWAALKLLFPGKDARANWGLLFVGALPPMIYLSQSITNEAFAAMLVSVCIWLTLRALQREHLTWPTCMVLGVCLGAALLAKSTALLILPFVFGIFLWQWLRNRTLTFQQWIARIGVMMLMCALIGGWHYGRLWLDFGNPLVANWDNTLGFFWWQDAGFRTNGFYSQFGDVLLHPWSAVSHSLGDGLYATLWGDGSLSGSSGLFTRPLWNYDLMSIGYWLALIPTSMVLAGGILAIARFIRRPTPEWFFLLGFGGLAVWAVVYISLLVPYFSLVKAFFALSALIPLCAMGAWGLNSLTRLNSKLAAILGIMFLVWSVNSYTSFWASRSSAQWAYAQSIELIKEGRLQNAIEFLEQRRDSAPHDADLQFVLAVFLFQHRRLEKAIEQTRAMIKQHPADSRGAYLMALAFSEKNQPVVAIAQFQKIIAMTPVFDPSWQAFTPLLNACRTGEMIDFCRQALTIVPYNPDLRLIFGVALVWQGQNIEARTQLNYVCLSNPNALDVLADGAWELATAPDAASRNGPIAVRFAEFICDFTKYGNRRFLKCLAAAYAEDNRYAEAIKCAERAEALAVASADFQEIVASQDQLQNLRKGLPYRQK